MPKTSPPAGPVPLAIWPVAQTSAQQQRRDRYVPESAAHPGKMLPALAQRIIEEYSSPGDLLLDPMCGIGTSLMEAASLDRRCIGIDLESRWIEIAQKNIASALSAEQQSLVDARIGDVRLLPESLGTAYGTVDLILTSPPYGCEVSRIDGASYASGGNIKDFGTQNYSSDRDNLGHARGDNYLEALHDIYQQCLGALRPGGLLVTVTKNMRKQYGLVDLAGATTQIAQSLGFRYLQLPLAALLSAIGHFESRRSESWSSWSAHGFGLVAAVVPTALIVSGADEGFTRPIALALAGLVLLLSGARYRLQAPLVIGALTLSFVALVQLLPYADDVPRWVATGAVGVLLVTLGATYEKRLRDINALRARYESLR